MQSTSLFVASLSIAIAAGCSSSTAGEPSPQADAPASSPPPKPPKAPAAPEPDEGSSSTPGVPNTGPCTGQPGELYALAARSLASMEQVPLCKFKGRVLLVVNGASQCGYTPQYAPLQELYTKYTSKGFDVLGFPSKSFNQEFDSEDDIKSFCTTEYKITFPMFAIGNVNPPDEQPLYTFLKDAWAKTHPDDPRDVGWNFEKFLVSRSGKVVGRFLSGVEPTDPTLIAAIEAEIAKP